MDFRRKLGEVVRLRPKTVPARAFRMDSEHLMIGGTLDELVSFGDSASSDTPIPIANPDAEKDVVFSERRQSGDDIND